MKILYAVQGTGNGHVSRAREILPYLQALADVDVMLSGAKPQLDVGMPVAVYRPGLTLAFDADGRLNPWRTARELGLWRFVQDVRELDVKKYDLVINDFEPVSAWACRMRGVPCVSFSNQAAFLSPRVPRPKRRRAVDEWVLRVFAPGSSAVGLHFECYEPWIHTPIIREDVRRLRVSYDGPVAVYLLTFPSPEVAHALGQIPEQDFELFVKPGECFEVPRNVKLCDVSAAAFTQAEARCAGIVTSAGFGTTSEALHLGKRLLVLPIPGHYEQQCNAAALRRLGVTVVDGGVSGLTVETVRAWLAGDSPVPRHYPDETADIVRDIIDRASHVS